MPDPEAGNVYAPPAAAIGERIEPVGEFEALRRACIGREASIKGIGGLSLLCAVLYGFALVGALAGPGGGDPGRFLGLAVLFGLFGVSLAIGIGLRRLLPWARHVFTALAGLGIALPLGAAVLRFGEVDPIGVLVWAAVLAAFLWVLWSRPAATIFSLHYRSVVVPATPGVRYRTPLWLWLVLVGVIIAVAAISVVGLRR